MRTLKYCFFLILSAAIFSGCAGQKIIVNDLEELEANEIIVFLANHNITAQKIAAEASRTGGRDQSTKWNIGISPIDAMRAMSLLTKNGLPRRKGTDLLTLFAKGGLVPSELEENIRFQQGLAMQISNSIRKIDGIIEADVQLSFPKEDPLNPEKTVGKTTAAVFVKHQGILDDPNSLLITKIKRLVAASIQDLTFDDVTIIADRARFSAVSPIAKDPNAQSQEGLVEIWSMIIAIQSAMRFRLVFFSFIVIILLLLGFSLLMIWKFFPTLQQAGGIKNLFNLHQIIIEKPPEKEKPKEEETEEEDEEEEEDESLEEEEEELEDIGDEEEEETEIEEEKNE